MSDIVVYGRGKTGQSLAKMLKKQGKSVKTYDDTDNCALSDFFHRGDTVIVSPGVKPTAKGIAEAEKAGANIIGELEYCFDLCKGKCISVTGTNGKTTTCEMIYHILQKRGNPSYLLGNGGIPFSESVLEVKTDDIVVLESSSFQLSTCKKFAPYVSVFTNFAPDHLDYHGDMAAYAQAKINNFVHQKSGYAIFNIDDKDVAEFSLLCKCKKLTFSILDKNATCYYNGIEVALIVDGRRYAVKTDCLNKLAKHNRYNALSACLACYCVGVPLDFSLTALEDYVLLPHRLQFVAKIGKVSFVDDSKATNVHATVSALDNYSENVALILGGSNKGENYDAIFQKRRSNLLKVAAVGETAKAISRCASKYGVHIEIFDDIKQAARSCYHFLKDVGGVVLMSNACASFDSFNNYAERGDYFQKVVGDLYDGE